MSVHDFQKRGQQPPDGELPSRVAKLEATAEAMDKRLSLIETDIRAIGKKLDTHFYITWAGIIGLATLLGKGFGWF